MKQLLAIGIFLLAGSSMSAGSQPVCDIDRHAFCLSGLQWNSNGNGTTLSGVVWNRSERAVTDVHVALNVLNVNGTLEKIIAPEITSIEAGASHSFTAAIHTDFDSVMAIRPVRLSFSSAKSDGSANPFQQTAAFALSESAEDQRTWQRSHGYPAFAIGRNTASKVGERTTPRR